MLVRFLSDMACICSSFIFSDSVVFHCVAIPPPPSFLLKTSIDGYSYWFQIETIIKSVIMNTCIFMLKFCWRYLSRFWKWLYQFVLLSTGYVKSSLPIFLPVLDALSLFHLGHSDELKNFLFIFFYFGSHFFPHLILLVYKCFAVLDLE